VGVVACILAQSAFSMSGVISFSGGGVPVSVMTPVMSAAAAIDPAPIMPAAINKTIFPKAWPDFISKFSKLEYNVIEFTSQVVCETFL
jgi:hypothetical protein